MNRLLSTLSNLPPRLLSAAKSRLVGTFCLLLFSLCLSAKDIYIAQTAQGSGNGTSAANAYAVTWFNTAGNWGSGGSQINPGDTVHLCGTITSVLTIQASGTASAQTTIYFESGANITVPYFPQYTAGGQINGNSKSYYTIDGGGHGWMTATSSYGNSGAYPAAIVPGTSGTIVGVTIQNLTITNVYAMQNNANGDSTEATAIFAYNLLVTNFTVRGCLLGQAYSGLSLLYAGGHSYNVQIYSNTIVHCNWLTRVAPYTGSSIMDTVKQYGNIGDYIGTDYDDSNDDNHHDGFFWDASAVGSWTTNVSIFGNALGPNLGAHTTAHIYFSAAGGGGHHAGLIYNNVFSIASSVSAASPGDGCIYLWGFTGDVYNNTISDARNGSGACIEVTTDTPALVNVENNIITGCKACIANHIGTWDYNLYDYSGGAPSLMNNQTWSGWQSSGHDTHSIVADPLYVSASAYNFAIQSGSPAIGATPQNFSSLFTTDIAGKTRPSSGNWTIGAYLYGSGSPGVDISIGAQPTSQSAYVGQTATFSVAASGGSTLSYQWQTNGVNVSGATSSSWTTPALTAGWNGLGVDVNVTDPSGTLESSVVNLTVDADPSITAQPQSASVSAGSTATFSVTASGQTTLSCQWQTNGADVSGATSASWTTPTLTTAWSGLSVDVVVTDTAGSLTSSSATLTVTGSSGVNPATGVHAVAYSANAANITTAAITTQTSGSTILIWVGSGSLSEVEGKVPTDNKGNTYHSTGPNAYASYPTSGENLYICTNATGGSGHTFTWPGEAEMESTIMVIEVKNGGKVASVTTNSVGTVSGTQTSSYVANTAPASIVAVWAGDAGATSSSANPNNSFNVLDTQALASGYVEGVTASKDLSSAGNNDVVWTQNMGQGANMRMVAVQGIGSTPAPAPPTQFQAKQVYARTLIVNPQ